MEKTDAAVIVSGHEHGTSSIQKGREQSDRRHAHWPDENGL